VVLEYQAVSAISAAHAF